MGGALSVDGKPKKLTLDGALTLAAARKAAADALHELGAGRDPAALKIEPRQRRESRCRACRRHGRTMGAQFIELHAGARPRADLGGRPSSVFDNSCCRPGAAVPSTTSSAATSSSCSSRVAVDRPIMANRTHAPVQVLQLAVRARRDRGLALRRREAAERGERARARSHRRRDQVGCGWPATPSAAQPAHASRSLLLTGQRRCEVAGMRRSEINGDVWVLPPERTKNKRRHEVPLSRASAGHHRSDAGDRRRDGLRFHLGQNAALSHFSHAKQAIDAHMKPDDAVGPCTTCGARWRAGWRGSASSCR